ncbi:FAD-dependent oxidoreductase [Coleofasciculus sp. E2-BRE-01]|uniref:FAD-dependent oxidoreductase n=1 Tax=Coleofasciculus sp. E2-BRE-01 TaxID=3069524 RepID=UPI0032F0D842
MEITANVQETPVKTPQKVIVIGGSIAGLLTARVLADHFDQVTIIERDRVPEQPESRAGVPQSHQLHVLLTQGYRILNQLFPGLEEELAGLDVSTLNWTADFQWLLPGGWSPRFPSHLKTQACSRNLLEFLIRKRLAAYRNLDFKEATTVTGLLLNPNRTTVEGVKLRNSNGTDTQLSAQFVVDASGRNSQTPQWLKNVGYEAPQETIVNAFLGYASRWYQSLGNEPLDYHVLYLMPQAPHQSRGGVLYRVEGDRWIVCLIGVGRDYPPTDEAGFLDFAQSLSDPSVYEAIKNAQPISPIYGYRRTENRLRHYERLSHFPNNFVVVGDAVCTFNPVYGQGMTVASLAALVLDQCFKQYTQHRSNPDLKDLGKHFQKKLALVNQTPWLMATADDLRWSTTAGDKPNIITRFLQQYIDKVILVASERAEVYQSFIEVIHLIKPTTIFFKPSILWQVIRQAFS